MDRGDDRRYRTRSGLSGVLLEHFWWGSVFLINVPAMVLLMILGPSLLPETRASIRRRFDLAGSVLALATVLPAIYGIKQWATEGFRPLYLLAIVVGLAMGALFVLRQKRAVDPMLDLSLFAAKLFTASAVSNAIAMFALVGNAVFLTQYLQAVKGLSPLAAAIWSIVPSIAVAAAAPMATALAGRIGRLPVICGGFVVAAIGFSTMTMVTATGSIAVPLIGSGILAAGAVAVLSLAAEISLATTGPERAGTVAAVVDTSGEFGGELGIAILGSVGAASYSAAVVAGAPAGLPADMLTRISSTIGEAVATAQSIGGSTSTALLDTARSAFAHSITVVSVCGAALLVVAAVSIWALGRGAENTVSENKVPADAATQ